MLFFTTAHSKHCASLFDSLFLLSTDYVLQLQHSPVSSAQLSMYFQRTKGESQTKNRPDHATPFSYLHFSYLLPLAFLLFIFLPVLSFSHHFSIDFSSLLPSYPFLFHLRE